MVDLALLQSISYIAGALGVCVAAAYYVLMVRNQERARQAQLFMQIYQTAISTEMNEAELRLFGVPFKDVDDYNKLLENKEEYKAWMYYGGLLEGIGVLVKEGLIDIRLPILLISGNMFWFWGKYREGILDVRSKLKWPRFMIETEYLFDRCIEYGKAHPELGVSPPSIPALSR